MNGYEINIIYKPSRERCDNNVLPSTIPSTNPLTLVPKLLHTSRFTTNIENTDFESDYNIEKFNSRLIIRTQIKSLKKFKQTIQRNRLNKIWSRIIKTKL